MVLGNLKPVFGILWIYGRVIIPSNRISPPRHYPLKAGSAGHFRRPAMKFGIRAQPGPPLIFAPPGEGGGCEIDPAWVVAVADGLIVRAKNGAVIQDLDNDVMSRLVGQFYICMLLPANAFSRVPMFTPVIVSVILRVKAAYRMQPIYTWRGVITANGSLPMGIPPLSWMDGFRVVTVSNTTAI